MIRLKVIRICWFLDFLKFFNLKKKFKNPTNKARRVGCQPEAKQLQQLDREIPDGTGVLSEQLDKDTERS